MLAQKNVEVVVVDYSCWQGTAAWVRQHHPDAKLVEVHDRQRFDRGEAKNLAAFAASSDWLCLIDADVLLEPDFAERIRSLLRPECFLRADRDAEGTGGTIVVPRAAFERVGGHDPVYLDWGEEDDDLVDALHFLGLRQRGFPVGWVCHIEHDDALRTRFHEEPDRRISHMANRVYRAMKWDLARLSGRVPELSVRRDLYTGIRQQMRASLASGEDSEVRIDAQRMHWLPVSATCRRELVYRLELTNSTEPSEGSPRE
jgi:glycosyltransferase involved in cell wall biosynthesis